MIHFSLSSSRIYTYIHNLRRRYIQSKMAKSMSYNMASGMQNMLKDGHKTFSGVDEAVIRNIEAAKGLSKIVASSFGPNGTCLRFP